MSIALIIMKRFANTVAVFVSIMALTPYMTITCRAQAQNEKVAQQVAQFPVGKNFLEIPFQLERDRAIILLTVNNSSPLKFLVDTGSKTPNLRGAAPAESLGLKIIGDAIVGGAGSGAETTARIAGAVTFNISGATLKGAEMLVPPPPAPTLAPLSSYGVIGRPLFDNFVVEFDWAKQVIRLYDPAKYIYSGKGTVLPLTFDKDGYPYTTAALNITDDTPIPVKLFIDTGANLALGLDMGSHPDIKLPERSIATIVGVGAQGTVSGHFGRVKSLQIGSYKFKDIFTNYAAASNPYIGEAGTQGLIGNEVLRRFKVIFDYSRKQMILEPNRFFKEPFQGSLTGIASTRTYPDMKELKVNNVFENSPAKDAGLLVGDEIIKINNRPVSEFTDDDLYRIFRKRGARFTLEIKRNGKQFEKKIKLRRFI